MTVDGAGRPAEIVLPEAAEPAADVSEGRDTPAPPPSDGEVAAAPSKTARRPAKRAAKKTTARPSAGGATADSLPRRRTPMFPAATFEDALELATAIYRFGSGQPVRRISLFDDLGKSPESGPSRQLIPIAADTASPRAATRRTFLN